MEYLVLRQVNEIFRYIHTLKPIIHRLYCIDFYYILYFDKHICMPAT